MRLTRQILIEGSEIFASAVNILETANIPFSASCAAGKFFQDFTEIFGREREGKTFYKDSCAVPR